MLLTLWDQELFLNDNLYFEKEKESLCYKNFVKSSSSSTGIKIKWINGKGQHLAYKNIQRSKY